MDKFGYDEIAIGADSTGENVADRAANRELRAVIVVPVDSSQHRWDESF